MKHQILEVGQTVNYVDSTGKIQSAKIAQIYHEDAARVEWDKHAAVAEFSDKKQPGTFHFSESATATAASGKNQSPGAAGKAVSA